MAYLAEGAMDYLHGASLSLVVLLFMPTLMNVMFQEGKSKYCLISIGCQLVINIAGDLYRGQVFDAPLDAWFLVIYFYTAKSNGRSLMSFRRLPVIRILSISMESSAPTSLTASTSSLRAK